MTDWVRLWHDMPTDPKWRVIARKSGQPLVCVIAVFNLMMVSASGNADDRGTMLGWDDEDAGAALDMDAEAVTAIRQAMQGKVLDADRLSGWDRRQPKRERENDNSSQRVTKHRANVKNGPSDDVTPCNAMKRHETPREEQSREDTDDSVSNETAPIDPEKVMFDHGIALITSCGRSESSARSWLGRAKREHGAELVITMIGRAKREGAVDPISFMEGGLKAKARASPSEVIC